MSVRWVDNSVMNKRISFPVVYIIFITVLVIMVVYYNCDVKEKAISVLHYIPIVSTTAHSDGTITTSCVTGRPCTYQDVVDLRVIVITFNRPDSLTKLLRSLDTLVLDGHRAALEIWIDRDRKKNGVHQRTLEVASAFNWTGGATRVNVQVALYCVRVYLYLRVETRSVMSLLNRF